MNNKEQISKVHPDPIGNPLISATNSNGGDELTIDNLTERLKKSSGNGNDDDDDDEDDDDFSYNEDGDASDEIIRRISHSGLNIPSQFVQSNYNASGSGVTRSTLNQQNKDRSSIFGGLVKRPLRTSMMTKSMLTMKSKAKRVKYIYVNYRILHISNINMAEQSFHSTFDMDVSWTPTLAGEMKRAHDVQIENAKGVKSPQALLFEPIIRFPTSLKTEERMRLYFADKETKKIGMRLTIAGSFKCVQDLHGFPFDAQALHIECQIGKDKVEGIDLHFPEYQFKQSATKANLITYQIDSQYDFRPLRYFLTTTRQLESDYPFSKFVLVIPSERDFHVFTWNFYFVVFLPLFMSFSVFFLHAWDLGNRLMTTSTLFLSIVAIKFVLQESLPKIPYLTAFDRYLGFSFIYLTILYSTLPIAHYFDDCTYETDHCAFTLETQPGTIICAFVFAIIFISCHIYFFLNAKSLYKEARKEIATMGFMDPVLKEKLSSAGIIFNKDGEIANIEKYHQMLND